MRTIVDIPDETLPVLDQWAKQNHVSRAAVIREAISMYLENKPLSSEEDFFGLWKNREVDGVEYQKTLREEWS
jgi:metal-responsive CopG/Arc/MetJ family transcriptional regulator